MIPELELLDACAHGNCPGHSETFVNAVNWLYEGDCARLLYVIKKMRQDGTLEMRLDGTPIEDWQLDAWLRSPDTIETTAALQRVTLRITAVGLKFI